MFECMKAQRMKSKKKKKRKRLNRKNDRHVQPMMQKINYEG